MMVSFDLEIFVSPEKPEQPEPPNNDGPWEKDNAGYWIRKWNRHELS